MIQLKELKAYLTKQVVREILESLGYQFNRAGQFRLRDERTPSASIRRDGFIKDFGSGWSGDIFALLQEYHGMTLKEAIDYVANFLGISSNVPAHVQKAPKFKQTEYKSSYDITNIYNRFKRQLKNTPKIKEQIQRDLLPLHISKQLNKETLKKMIGYDKRNESFTISLLKGDEVKAVTIQRTKDGTKWKTYGKKSYIPYRVTLKPYVFVVFGMKEILIMESWKGTIKKPKFDPVKNKLIEVSEYWEAPYIGFQSDSIAKGIANNPQGAELKEAIAGKTLILLLDNDTSCIETIKALHLFFVDNDIIAVDFQAMLPDKELPKGYDFYDFVLFCNWDDDHNRPLDQGMEVIKFMIDDYIEGVAPYEDKAPTIPALNTEIIEEVA